MQSLSHNLGAAAWAGAAGVFASGIDHPREAIPGGGGKTKPGR